MNELDRYHLALVAIRRVPGLAGCAEKAVAAIERNLASHRAYVRQNGEDMPEIRDWQWASK